MAYNMNFDSPLQVREGKLVVKGRSEHVEGTLVARHVVVRQDPDGFDTGPASDGVGWRADLDAESFTRGDALATGTETYVVDTRGTGDARAMVVTVNWSEIVRIET